MRSIDSDTIGAIVANDTFLIHVEDGTPRRFTNEGDLLHDDVSCLAENLPVHSDISGEVPVLGNSFLEDGRSVEAENVEGTLTVSITDYRGPAIQGDGDDNEIHARKTGGTVQGFSGDDPIHGNDLLNGGAGHDIIAPGWMHNETDGGAGTDCLDENHDGGHDTPITIEWNGTCDIDLSTGETNRAGETAIGFEGAITGDGDNEITRIWRALLQNSGCGRFPTGIHAVRGLV